jgi:hypothetical protein
MERCDGFCKSNRHLEECDTFRKSQRGLETVTSDADLSWQIYRATLKHGDEAKVAESLGLSPFALKQLLADDPVLRNAMDAALADRLPACFHDLSDESKAIWDTLHNPPSADAKQAALIALANNGERERKKLLAWGLLNNYFDVTGACRALKIGIRQYESWLKTDSEFAELVADVQSAKKHFVEGRLMSMVALGSEKATLFAAERLMKDVYGKTLTVEGNVTHTHSTIDLGRLPLKTKAAIFELLEEANIITPDGLISYDFVDAAEVKTLT